jgi:hypothetical protein
MQYSATITFDAADQAAALAEMQSWQLPAGATVHALTAMEMVQGMPATVTDAGKLELTPPPAAPPLEPEPVT